MTPGTATKPRPAPSSDWALDSPNLFVFPTHYEVAVSSGQNLWTICLSFHQKLDSNKSPEGFKLDKKG